MGRTATTEPQCLYKGDLYLSLTRTQQGIKERNISITDHKHQPFVGRNSSVGIATGYGLDGPGIESRWEARFSAPVQTGPGAHPVSCTMGTGSFLGVKSGRGVTLTPHPLLVPWS